MALLNSLMFGASFIFILMTLSVSAGNLTPRMGRQLSMNTNKQSESSASRLFGELVEEIVDEFVEYRYGNRPSDYFGGSEGSDSEERKSIDRIQILSPPAPSSGYSSNRFSVQPIHNPYNDNYHYGSNNNNVVGQYNSNPTSGGSSSYYYGTPNRGSSTFYRPVNSNNNGYYGGLRPSYGK